MSSRNTGMPSVRQVAESVHWKKLLFQGRIRQPLWLGLYHKAIGREVHEPDVRLQGSLLTYVDDIG